MPIGIEFYCTYGRKYKLVDAFEDAEARHLVLSRAD